MKKSCYLLKFSLLTSSKSTKNYVYEASKRRRSRWLSNEMMASGWMRKQVCAITKRNNNNKKTSKGAYNNFISSMRSYKRVSTFCPLFLFDGVGKKGCLLRVGILLSCATCHSTITPSRAAAWRGKRHEAFSEQRESCVVEQYVATYKKESKKLELNERNGLANG